MIILAVDHVHKSYGANQVLSQFSFEIQDRDRLGIVGRNGAGKTTLFKLISGLESPDEGHIHLKKNLRVGYLEQIPSIDGGLNGKEVLQLAFTDLLQLELSIHELSSQIAGLSTEDGQLDGLLHRLDELQKLFELRGGYEMEQRMNRIVEGLKIKESILVQSFALMSGGEKTRLLLGRILLEEPELLLLDEPTNHLDLEALEWLETYLASYKGAMMMISHDRQFLDQTATAILEFEEGGGRLWPGNYSQYKHDRDEWQQQQIEIYRQQQKKVRAMEEAIRRFEDWGTRADNKAMFVKARNMEKRLEKMDKIDRPNTKQKKMGLAFKSDGRTGNQVFRLRDVSLGYEDRCLIRNVNLDIEYKDCAVLMGANGVGKTTLFKVLKGEKEASSGEVKIGSKVKLGVLDQEVSFENEKRTVLELFNGETLIGEFTARGKLARFMFFSEDLSKKIHQLSGGERVRLKLCLMMEEGINVLLLDEPTNHMDIPSREVLEMALAQFEGTVLMISHDRYFVKKLADKLLFLGPEGIQSYEGDYEDWRAGEMERSELPPPLLSPIPSLPPMKNDWKNAEDRGRQNELRRAKQRLEILESYLSAQTKALSEVTDALENPDLSYEAVQALYEKQNQIQSLLNDGEAEWLSLMEVCDES